MESLALKRLLTKLRNVNTNAVDFQRYAKRALRLIAEEGLAAIHASETTVTTPTGDTYSGISSEGSVNVVSIIRAGDALLSAVLECEPGLPVGKILIQRNEDSVRKEPVMYYSKLPRNIKQSSVLLVDPMLATGGSLNLAIQTLLAAGVVEKNILALVVVSCPEGLQAVQEKYPDVRVLSGVVDNGLNGDKYIVPGLGDFGDRYFNTV